MADFSSNSLSNNPNFDLVKILSQIHADDENKSDFVSSNSPYDLSEILCTYMSETELICHPKFFVQPSVLSINIQSLSAKFAEFRESILSFSRNNCAPDIICLQEIWRIHDSTIFNIDGYHHLVYKSRSNNVQGGGVGIYVKNNLNFVINDVLSIFVDRIFESLFIEVKFNSSKFVIGSVYRPGTQHPTFSIQEQFTQFCDLFSSISDYIINKNLSSYIFGDFNLDCLKYGSNNSVTEYVDLLFSHGMLQVVTKPTRCTVTSATLIDHVISNVNSRKFETIILTSLLSDHFPLFHFLNFRKAIVHPKTVTSRDNTEDSINRFNDSLSAMSWNNVIQSNDPQLSFNNFTETFSSLHDIHLPIVTKKFNRNFHKIEPWITNGLLTSRRQKINLEKIHFANPSIISLEAFKKFRNLYNKVLRAAKKLYFEKELRANQSNLKKSWDLIKTAMNRKSDKSSSIGSILLNNVTISDPQLIANHFNDFFTSIPSSIIDEINPKDRPPDENYNDDIPLFSLCNPPVTPNEIIEACRQLSPKKTLDITGLSSWLLQKLIVNLAAPLCHIFKHSFAAGIVPHQLKIAKIIPVFKSGRKDVMDNYRPISLLSCFSKLIEKIVCTRLTSFLDINNLISNSQFGFRKKHSTLHPLVHFLNYVAEALDKKQHCIAIFCDLRKAFDTVNHQILLDKLKKMGVRGSELSWFQDYLTNRMQLVSINGFSSLLKILSIGVPQGSILGPLLFLIYINDLPLCSQLFALLFADDTTLLLADSNLNNLIANVNREFKKISDFFRSHKLALHPDKTKFILFTNSPDVRAQEVDIVLNSNNEDDIQSEVLISHLSRVTSESVVPAVKFLGIFIDPALNFKYHINSICSKVSKSMFFLRSVKNFLPAPALKSIYFAIIHSHFVYGNQIWSCTSPSNLNVLFIKQKAAVRIINNSSYNSHTEPIFKSLSILPLSSLIEYFKIQFMYNFVNGELPGSFEFTWIRNENREGANLRPLLRNHTDIFIPPSRLTSTDKFPLFNFPRVWSSFPDSIIKNLTSKSEFNSKLKTFYLNKLSSSYTCNRLLCPHCHLNA